MRALIPLLCLLQATPAIWRPDSVRGWVTSPVPDGQRSLHLATPVGPVDAVWLHADRRDHVAVREPFGTAAVLRSDGSRLGLTVRGRPEVVASADAAVRLSTQDTLGLSDLLPLLVGRLPPGMRLVPLGHGWLALRGELVAVLSRDGHLLGATWGASTLVGQTLTVGSQRVEFTVGPVDRRPIPDGAFSVGDGDHVPVEVLGQVLASRTSAISN